MATVRTPPGTPGHVAAEHEQEPAIDEAEKKRRNDLKTLRRFRTMRRNVMREDLQSVVGLNSPNPVFPDRCAPDSMVNRIVQHANTIHEYCAQISALIESDTEWNKELPEAQTFTQEAVAAVAAIQAANERLNSQATASGVQPAVIAPTNIAPTVPETQHPSDLGTSDSPRTGSDGQINCAGSNESIPIPQSSFAPVITTHADQLTREYDMTPRVFSGDRLQFRTFIAEFEEYVGRRKDVSSMRKLIILRKFLRGEPLIIVEALELNEANYKIALSLLEKNYSRVGSEKRKIIGELRSLPVVSKPYDYAGLSRLVTTVQSHISILAVNGVSLPEFALTLMESMEVALPLRVRQEFLAQQQADEKYGACSSSSSTSEAASSQTQSSAGSSAAREVEDLIEFLRQRLRNMERLKIEESVTGLIEKKPHENSRKHQDRKHRPFTTVAAVSARAAPGKNSTARLPFQTKQCLFCKSNDHASSRCSSDIGVPQRLGILRSLNRCETCFRTSHTNPADCRGPRSECLKCKSKAHYTAVHPDKTATTDVTVATAMALQSCAAKNTLLWTACAYVLNSGQRIPVRLFIDPGSSLTVATPALCSRLRSPPIGRCDLAVQAFFGSQNLQGVHVFPLRLVGPCGGTEVELQACEHELTVNPANVAPSRVMEAVRKFDRQCPLADRSYVGEWSSDPPDILVGMDQIHELLLDSAPRVVLGGIRAHESRFGFIIGGPIERSSSPNSTRATERQLVCCAATLSQGPYPVLTKMNQPARALKRLWDLEALGIIDVPSTSQMSADEESALLQFQSSLTYASNHYTVGIPKRSSISSFPNNYMSAVDRLEKKLSQLRRNPGRYQRYHAELMKFVEKGFARKIAAPSPGEASTCNGSFYMPHHEIITTSNSTEKWRVVFDCSAKSQGGTSLNDHLLPGPNLNPELVTLLLNFRLHQVALSGDITQAYMQIRIRGEDQPYFRFLWRAPDAPEIQTFQMQRVTWGAAPSGFILAAVLREHFQRSGSDAIGRYGSRFYADDYLASFPTQQSAIEATDELRRILQAAGMELAKWKSNSAPVLKHLTSTGVGGESFDHGSGGLFRVLGLTWVADRDVFRFRMPSMSHRAVPGKRNTKREALGIVAALYDPLGWVMPYSLRGKRLIQKIWTTKLDWNQQITEDAQQELQRWTDEMSAFGELEIPRQYFPSDRCSVARNLHVFGDASPIAFAAAAYVEHRYDDGSSHCALVMSRSRLAPLNTQTLPRLELLAALIATRLKNFIIERIEVVFDNVRLYTDSMITYHWVTSENPGTWRTYVFNRVKEIQANSSKDEWRHVRGEDNVADLATRGIPAEQLIESPQWWQGPAWLGLPEERRPISQPRSAAADAVHLVTSELKKVVSPVVLSADIVNLDRFSNSRQAIRVFSYVLQFVRRLRRLPELGFVELCRLAELQLIRATQQHYFKDEIARTRNGERPHGSSKLAAFNLFVDNDDLLRAKTRLTEGIMLSYDEKNPIVLPGQSRLAQLYIVDAHRINAHFGVSTVLSYVRRRFWVTRGRQVIKSMLLRCVVCRKKHGKPAAQMEAPLPEVRVDLCSSFQAAGLDFAGPFFTRLRGETVKTYIALFSCTTTRAIHLEAVPSITTPQTVLAIRRFLAVYPSCTTFISDNGRSFVKAATEIKALFNSRREPEVRELLRSRFVEWRFNCPRAPNQGGFFEKMVALMKTAMTKTLGRSLIGYEEFRTILCELASAVNSRPLTYVSADSNEPTPITPAHFIRGGPLQTPLATLTNIDRLASDECPTAEELRRGLKHRTTFFRNLSARWFREYLLLLRSANATVGGQAEPIPLGEVCLLKDDNLPRIKWQLVRIVEQHPGRDGKIRTYSIRLANGRVTRRSARVLYPLEVREAPPHAVAVESN